MNLIKIINLKLTMIPTKDYDIIFENFLNNELEVLYKDLIQFFSTNYSKALKLALPMLMILVSPGFLPS